MKFDINLVKWIVCILIFGSILTGVCCFISLIFPEYDISKLTRTLIFNASFPPRSFKYPELGIKIFMIGYGLLYCWFGFRLTATIGILNDAIRERMFHNKQADELKKVADTVIAFAKLKFTLVMLCGVFFLMAPFNVLGFLPMFISLYILGKVILVFSFFLKNGQVIKQENELTI